MLLRSIKLPKHRNSDAKTAAVAGSASMGGTKPHTPSSPPLWGVDDLTINSAKNDLTSLDLTRQDDRSSLSLVSPFLVYLINAILLHINPPLPGCSKKWKFARFYASNLSFWEKFCG